MATKIIKSNANIIFSLLLKHLDEAVGGVILQNPFKNVVITPIHKTYLKL